MRAVEMINRVIMYLFFICYFYQFIYTAVSLFYKAKQRKMKKEGPREASASLGDVSSTEEAVHRIAVLIAARNEEAVIGGLLDSIKAQSYPMEYVDVYVGADNCTDGTAATAREHGATVFERNDPENVGKGYVLKYLLKEIAQSVKKYDAYVVLDADNVLDPNFIREIDRVYSDGSEIVTCYRNSKNYGDNWISAGYALWFLREARYLNAARMALGSSCAVSGTGFLFSDSVLKSCGGWHFFLLTEDIEFTIDNIIRGRKVGYAEKAVLYDEQPVSFVQSLRQRLRWAKGNFQVFIKYRKQLMGGIFHGSFSCYDMTMTVMPAAILTVFSAVVNVGAAVFCVLKGGLPSTFRSSILYTLAGGYMTFFMMGALTTATEWKNIYCPMWKKVLYAFTFPLFMLTYIPVCMAALFAKVGWKPIRHCRNLTLKQIKEVDRLPN